MRKTVGSRRAALGDARMCRENLLQLAGAEAVAGDVDDLRPAVPRRAPPCVVLRRHVSSTSDQRRRAPRRAARRGGLVQKLAARYACQNVKKLLVGNKCDLASKRAVPAEQAQEFAECWAASAGGMGVRGWGRG